LGSQAIDITGDLRETMYQVPAVSSGFAKVELVQALFRTRSLSAVGWLACYSLT